MGRPRGSRNRTREARVAPVVVERERARPEAPEGQEQAPERAPAAPRAVRDPQMMRKIGALKDRINKALINKKTGEADGRLYTPDEITPAFTLRRPTGLLSLDMAIAGGFPAGCITEVVAAEGVGKSTLANWVLAENQRVYGAKSAIFIACVEGQYDKDHGRDCGIRMAFSKAEIEKIEQSRGAPLAPELKKALMEDQIGEVVEIRAKSAEVLLDEVIEVVRSNYFHAGVVDSFAAMIPEAEDEGAMEDKQVAEKAKLIAKFCRKWGGIQSLDKDGLFNTTSLMVINQQIVKIGGFSPNPGVVPTEIPGGRALRYWKSLSVELKSSIGDRIESEETGDLIGKNITWKILKQKQGGHEGATAKFRYIFDTCQPDRAYDAYEVGLQHGIIKRNGTRGFIWGAENFPSEEAVVAVLKEVEKRDTLRNQLMQVLDIRCQIGQ